MELFLNILALAATGAVAYVGSIQGLYRSAMTLAACLIAGALGFGLLGPAAGLFPLGNFESVWYYAADAIALWAVFSVAFLALRTLGEVLLKTQPTFPLYVDRAGGAALGFATGYICTGLCIVLLQMLPMSPDVLGGYSPFRYDRDVNPPVKPGGRLWLNWDRGVLGLYQYVLSGPLGSQNGGFLARYGDLYPLEEVREAAKETGHKQPDGTGVVNADDFLYYHWYRRYLYSWWRTGQSLGPIPPKEAFGVQRPGLAMQFGQTGDIANVRFRVIRAFRTNQLAQFQDVRTDSSEDFLIVTLEFGPAGGLKQFPLTFDSARLVLVDRDDRRYAKPLVLGKAMAKEQASPEIQPGTMSKPPAEQKTIESPQFKFPERSAYGDFLAQRMTFTFADGRQGEQRQFVFVVPRSLGFQDLRLLYEPVPGGKEADTEKPK
jgi:uncharacterized membrane protein required for colicin V production